MVDTSTPLVAHQMELERLFNKNQLLPRIKYEFMHCEKFNFVEYMKANGIDREFGLDVLAQIALHRRADMQTMVGILRHHYESAQAVVDNLELCARADLLNWSPDLQLWIVQFTLSQDVQEELDRYQYPLPMVVEPKEVCSNKQSGYLLGTGSMILKDNHHDEDICLDHINRVNKIKFCVDTNVFKYISNTWRGLDKPKSGESKEDFERRKRAFEKYDRTAKDVIELLTKECDEFHLTHKYDKRGRIYCQGYHVNYQGNTWNKAVIKFAEGEAL